jgi:integrating conjugative element protein (TIGR03758 family)
VNATQQAVFQAGAGISPNAVLMAIASMVMVLIFVWALWVTFGTFRAWQEGNASLFDLAWSALRASIVVMVLGFYLR